MSLGVKGAGRRRRGQAKLVWADKPLTVDATRFAPLEEPLRVEIRFGILRFRVHARLLA
jgi:hypothetical protein